MVKFYFAEDYISSFWAQKIQMVIAALEALEYYWKDKG
ncbi:MAG: hypothetical protein Ct9H300mP4_12710 [Gammaproteobacteria bacterium]|nr:MAG: hypothetical protein Ct9H300mP4_12710 [Gammaproteobacteria bacterium]